RGIVTESSTACALAPRNAALTETTGGAILGNCATGKIGMQIKPAMTMTIEQTAAKIGRRKKKSIKLRNSGRAPRSLRRFDPRRYGLRRARRVEAPRARRALGRAMNPIMQWRRARLHGGCRRRP